MLDRRLSALLWLVLAGCPSDMGFPGGNGPGGGGGGGGNDEVEDPYWCCDPDEPQCLCEGYWHCTEGIAGKQCDQANPRLPDDGGQSNWDCAYQGRQIVCTGNAADHPDAGADGGWNCSSQNDSVTCSRDQDEGDHPDEGSGPWECSYSSDSGLRSCDESGDSGGGTEWDCTTARDGRETCTSRNADRPDGSGWSCVQAGGRDVCQGSDMPDGSGGGGWDCTQQGEIVRCENGEAQQPDEGGSVPWDCEWDEADGEIICVRGGDDGSLGGGGNDGGGGDDGDGGNDGREGGGGLPNDGNQNEGGGGGGNCECPPGAWRFCDTPTYCSWGTQDCTEPAAGQAQWSPCLEDNPPNNCFNGNMYDAEAEQCAIDSGYCAQDFWDLDWDGNTDETLGDGCQELACVAPGDDGGFGGWF